MKNRVDPILSTCFTSLVHDMLECELVSADHAFVLHGAALELRLAELVPRYTT